jgi:uncharacterized alpha-E superfamily protein
VLSDKPVDTFSLLKSPTEPMEIRRIPRVVPSSVADNTFWLGRNVERAENIARILRSMVPGVYRADPAEIPSLVRLHAGLQTSQSRIPGSRRKSPTFPMLEKELISMLTDSARTDSLPGTLAEVARIGGNVRERLSADMMLLVGKLRTAMQPKTKHASPAAHLLDHQATLTRCLELLSAFSGLERENINRGPGWLFMSIGRRLERAIYLVRQLRLIARPMATDEWAFLERLLEVQDSSMTYRARYYTTLHPLAVLDVLMADETNPRSLEFQLEHLGELYEKLPQHSPPDLQIILEATRSLRKFDLQTLHYPVAITGLPSSRRGSRGLARLDAYLANLEKALPQWSGNLSGQYFNHVHFQPVTVVE